MADTFGVTFDAWKAWKKAGSVGPEPALFRKGYIYENLDGAIRPVLYVVHNAKMVAERKYTVRLSLGMPG